MQKSGNLKKLNGGHIVAGENNLKIKDQGKLFVFPDLLFFKISLIAKTNLGSYFKRKAIKLIDDQC